MFWLGVEGYEQEEEEVRRDMVGVEWLFVAAFRPKSNRSGPPAFSYSIRPWHEM
jgi:hypothetical protein